MAKELAFITFWKPFVYFFKFLCISYIKSLSVAKNSRRRTFALFNIYFLLNSAAVVLVVAISANKLFEIFQGIGDNERFKSNPLYFYIDAVGFFGNYVAFVVIHFETLLKRHVEQEIVNLLIKINKCFENLNFIITYPKMRWKYWCKITGLILFLMSVQVISLFISFPLSILTRFFLFNMILIIAVIIVRARCFQIILFICIVGDILNDLNTMMKNTIQFICMKNFLIVLELQLVQCWRQVLHLLKCFYCVKLQFKTQFLCMQVIDKVRTSNEYQKGELLVH